MVGASSAADSGATDFTLDPAAISALAARAAIDPATTSALLSFLPRIAERPGLVDTAKRLLGGLLSKPRKEAMAEVAAAGVEQALGGDAGLFHLLLALLEIPAALRRHASLGVDERVSSATVRDLAIWCRHFNEKFGEVGVTHEILDWAQYYLRGDLYRLGALQLERTGFTGPLHAFRHRVTGEIRALAEPGAAFKNGGRSIAVPITGSAQPDIEVLVAGGSMEGPVVTGHPILPGGAVSRELLTLDLAEYEPVLCPGTPMLEMHIPADARVTVATFHAALSEAFPFFARHFPGARPAGIFGEAWLLDPQVPRLVPRLGGIAAIQSICTLYPARIPEEKTIRRLFGPLATRATAVTAPREGMNLLQRAVADFLASPENVLCSAGGFLLNERIATFGVPVG